MNLTRENFERFLVALDPEPERAGAKYEQVRQSLIKFFAWRGEPSPEDLADETLNRVMQRMETINIAEVEDVTLYVFRIARNLLKEVNEEAVNHPVMHELPDNVPVTMGGEEADRDMLGHECLKRCLEKLPPESRELIHAYYEKQKAEKIDSRKSLAAQLGMPVNSLRVRVHRIRAQLHRCIKDCLEGKSQESD